MWIDQAYTDRSTNRAPEDAAKEAADTFTDGAPAPDGPQHCSYYKTRQTPP